MHCMDIVKERKGGRQWGTLLLGVGVLALFGSGLVGLTRFEPALPELDRATVWTGAVERGEFLIEVRATGRFVPASERWITAATSGLVESIAVADGDRLESGEALLLLSDDDVERQALEARLAARTERAEALAAEARLRNELLDLEARLATLEADRREAELRVGAGDRLAADGLVAPIELEIDRLRLEELTRRVELERARLERRHASLPTELQAGRSRVEQAERLAAFRESRRDGLRVVARSSGIVSDIAAEVGARVARGDRLARVIDNRKLLAQLDVPQAHAAEIRIGQRVRLGNGDDAFSGEVVRIDPAVLANVVRVDVAPDGELPDGARPEMRIDGEIEIARLDDVLHVRRPVDSRPDSEAALFRLEEDGSTARRIPVLFGRASLSTIQIVTGLTAGDRVILSDTSEIAEAARVRLR